MDARYTRPVATLLTRTGSSVWQDMLEDRARVAACLAGEPVAPRRDP